MCFRAIHAAGRALPREASGMIWRTDASGEAGNRWYRSPGSWHDAVVMTALPDPPASLESAEKPCVSGIIHDVLPQERAAPSSHLPYAREISGSRFF
jgi:hypothetical protein